VTRTQAAPVACGLVVVLWSRAARAVDVGVIESVPAQVDVTETSIGQQLFDKRENELPQNTGWGNWLNRLNAALRWGKWTAGLRLDSAIYWRRPVDNPLFQELSPSQQTAVLVDNESRYENALIPAKLWVTYAAPGIELTAGDAYVQFGRGLTLSMRKIDELGIDTTVRGAKVQIQKDPFAVIAVAGFGNPSRIDEASGRSLFPTHDLVQGDRQVAVFGSDRVVGVDLQAGRGLPVTLSTHAVHFTRCAPYEYDANGNIVTDFWQQPGSVAFGSCNESDTARWLQQLGQVPPLLSDREITMVGQSLELPDLWGHGKLYVEAAGQERRSDSLTIADAQPSGNAVYGALSVDFGPPAVPITSTLEIKSNRNFYVVPAGIDPTKAGEFSVVAYSFLPPAETFNMIDTEVSGNFNACVDGGRLRTDVSVSSDVLVYAQGIYAFTKSEQPNGGCDKFGNTISELPPSSVQDRVWDGIGGLEWYFDHKSSHVFLWGGARDDTTEDSHCRLPRAARRVRDCKVLRRPVVGRNPGTPPASFGRGDEYQRLVDRGRELCRRQDGAEVGFLPGIRVYDGRRSTFVVFQRRSPLSIHERLECPALRRATARGVPLRERRLSLLSSLRRRAPRVHAALLVQRDHPSFEERYGTRRGVED
jgi:hypothetical protein